VKSLLKDNPELADELEYKIMHELNPKLAEENEE
jgi:hypothetical protein